ncbi:hypothetical protein MASR2M117_16440 [Paludibacter sp.]
MLPKSLVAYFLSALIVVLSACSNRPKGVMSKGEMRAFLTEFHLLEGTLSSHPELSDREKAYYYQALFAKHHISKADFDSSIVYYTKNPKAFERIYTKVGSDLDELKSDVEAGKYLPVIPDSIKFKPEISNLWLRTTYFNFPKDTVDNTLNFNIKNNLLLTKDLYTFSFRMLSLSKDSSLTAYSALRIHYADGVVDSLWHVIKTDSVLRRYKFVLNARRNFKIDSLSGTFYYDKQISDSLKLKVDSILLNRKFVPFFQDSLRQNLDTAIVIKNKKDSIELVKKISSFKNISLSEKKEMLITW